MDNFFIKNQIALHVYLQYIFRENLTAVYRYYQNVND